MADERERFEAFHRLTAPRYRLLANLDGILLLRRDLQTLLNPSDLKRRVYDTKGPQALGGMADFPHHVIMDRGRVVGLWEYDPESQSIVWCAFQRANAALREAIEVAETFIRSDLGDAPSFSLDSPASRAPRIAALRQAGTK